VKLLDKKVAIITGASSGIGKAAAFLFAEQGAEIVLAARREKDLNDVVVQIEELGGKAVALVGDVKEESFSKGLVELAVQKFGKLDIALNNAGTLGALMPVTDMAVDEWHETINTNLTSAFLGAKYQIQAMQKQKAGSLIFTSSFVGYSAGGMPGMAAYAASKAGIIGLVQALASEYGHNGIRVNALLPGGTDTAMAPDTAEGRTYVENLHALKRIARPEEIAQSALYLASDMSSFMTGHAHLVDGGVSIHFA